MPIEILGISDIEFGRNVVGSRVSADCKSDPFLVHMSSEKDMSKLVELRAKRQTETV